MLLSHLRGGDLLRWMCSMTVVLLSHLRGGDLFL